MASSSMQVLMARELCPFRVVLREFWRKLTAAVELGRGGGDRRRQGSCWYSLVPDGDIAVGADGEGCHSIVSGKVRRRSTRRHLG